MKSKYTKNDAVIALYFLKKTTLQHFKFVKTGFIVSVFDLMSSLITLALFSDRSTYIFVFLV